MQPLARFARSGTLAPGRSWSAVLRAGFAAFLLVCAGCRLVGERPSNFRNWSPDMAALPAVEIRGGQARVHNIRNCTYFTQDAYVVDYYDKTYDLGALQSVDFIVVPFQGMPSLAHTMLSFGFQGDDYLAVSMEIRREQGEQYAYLKGLLDQYELMYVVGDERDLVKLRTNFRGDDVYVYRARATPEQARALFLDVVDRVNQLAAEPEFYNAITNNCTTNIARHINRLKPGKIPYELGVLLPGYSDRLAYDLGLLDTAVPFELARQRANVSQLARQYGDRPDFSALIRR